MLSTIIFFNIVLPIFSSDECRFPHVLPDGSGTHQVPYFSGRGGPRPRHVNGNGNGNGFHVINEKLAGMTVRDVRIHKYHGIYSILIIQQDASPPQAENMHSPSVDHGRPRFPQGPKNNYVANGVRPDKRPSAMKQRVPNADEFPVLAGSTTPPTRAPGLNGVLPNGNGHAVPTAAQVLQAPPPRKDSSKESSTRGTTPDPVKPSVTKVRVFRFLRDVFITDYVQIRLNPMESSQSPPLPLMTIQQPSYLSRLLQSQHLRCPRKSHFPPKILTASGRRSGRFCLFCSLSLFQSSVIGFWSAIHIVSYLVVSSLSTQY